MKHPLLLHVLILGFECIFSEGIVKIYSVVLKKLQCTLPILLVLFLCTYEYFLILLIGI